MLKKSMRSLKHNVDELSILDIKIRKQMRGNSIVWGSNRAVGEIISRFISHMLGLSNISNIWDVNGVGKASKCCELDSHLIRQDKFNEIK